MKSKPAVIPALIWLVILTSLCLSACGRPLISPPTPFPTYQSNSMPPLITSPDQATFTIGETGIFTITVSGSPLPGLETSGGLPNGLSLSPSKDGQAILSGSPASGTAGKASLAIKARNGFLPDAEQVLKLTILKANAAVSFELPKDGFQSGSASSLTVTVTGKPPIQGSPDGSITLQIDGSPTITRSLVDGRATFDSSSLEAGKHTLQASYSGDTTFASNPGLATEIVVADQAIRIYIPVISRP